MFGSFNPPLSLPLTVATSGFMIQGTLQTRLRRITDVLNEPTAEHLILFDATFMEVGSRRVAAGPGTAQIQLDDVLFVHTNGPTESGTEIRTPKQPTRAILIVWPFTIEGEVHLAYEAELHQALDALSGRFVPVTKARYWAYSVAESPNDVDLLVVNHSRAHIAIPAGVDWRTEAPDARPGGGADTW
ncbi:MAG: hypothetical protein ABSB75_06330 [Candidatus Limnocylindrales bacterium]